MPITTPTFTAKDNEDSTGTVLTVSNSDPGATNTFQFRTVEDNFDGVGSFTDGSDRVGDGDISQALTKGAILTGFFIGRIESVLGGDTEISEEVLVSVTDRTYPNGQALITRAIHAAKAFALTLEYPAYRTVILKSEQFYEFGLLDPALGMITEFPCVIFIFGDSKGEVGGTDRRDDVIIPVGCSVANRADNKGTVDNLNTENMMIEILEKNFRAVSEVVGLPENYNITLSPFDIWDEKLQAHSMFLTGHILNFTCRISRGT